MEFLGTGVMLIIFFSCFYTKQSVSASGGYVGAVVTLLINSLGPYTGGSMNPVRTLGPFMFANNYNPLNKETQPFTVYYLSTFLGGIAGWALCRYVIFIDIIKANEAKEKMIAKAINKNSVYPESTEREHMKGPNTKNSLES
jgi:hypothetical protein